MNRRTFLATTSRSGLQAVLARLSGAALPVSIKLLLPSNAQLKDVWPLRTKVLAFLIRDSASFHFRKSATALPRTTKEVELLLTLAPVCSLLQYRLVHWFPQLVLSFGSSTSGPSHSPPHVRGLETMLFLCPKDTAASSMQRRRAQEKCNMNSISMSRFSDRLVVCELVNANY